MVFLMFWVHSFFHIPMMALDRICTVNFIIIIIIIILNSSLSLLSLPSRSSPRTQESPNSNIRALHVRIYPSIEEFNKPSLRWAFRRRCEFFLANFRPFPPFLGPAKVIGIQQIFFTYFQNYFISNFCIRELLDSNVISHLHIEVFWDKGSALHNVDIRLEIDDVLKPSNLSNGPP